MATRKVRRNGKKVNCTAIVKRIYTAMKKKNPSATMADLKRRLEQLERSISDPVSKF